MMCWKWSSQENDHVAYHFVHNMQLLKAFEGRWLLLPWKQTVEAGLTWKIIWFVHYHVLSFEYVASKNKQAQFSGWL